MEDIDIQKQIEELEGLMYAHDFWTNKDRAQKIIKELKELKEKKDGVEMYDSGNAIMTILSGAGGDDAEDFSRMLFEMYCKYAEGKNFDVFIINKNENSLGGYRSITLEIQGKRVYGLLKNESGVHRLVRQSPFNSKGLRHTSFSMVEVIPVIPFREIKIKPEDIRVELSKSSGPGGQNVNKRETAVRIVHIPTNISSQASTERSQESNRQKALEMLAAKLYKEEEMRRKLELEGKQISKTTQVEWGSQIRSYILHPYKLIKDHRTEVERSDVENVLLGGQIDEFIEAENKL
jgi:peptide chain release factor 2